MSCAAMFFVAMSYSFMYGTLPARLSAMFWSLKEGHGLPKFNTMNGNVRLLCLLPSQMWPPERLRLTHRKWHNPA